MLASSPSASANRLASPEARRYPGASDVPRPSVPRERLAAAGTSDGPGARCTVYKTSVVTWTGALSTTVGRRRSRLDLPRRSAYTSPSRMAGQGLERREVLRMLALAAAASGHPGFHRWSFACAHGEDRLQVKPARYVPRFFSAEEYAVVERLADLVLPSEGTPGASEAGVAEFVDFMVDHDPGVQYRFRYGLVWLDARARKAHGRSFRKLPRADQEEILGALAYRARYRPGEEEGRAFFKLVREYTL